MPSLLLIILPRRATLPRGHSSQDGITSGSTPPCAVSVADHLPKPVGIHCLSAIEARTEARAGRRHRAPSLLLTILQIKACYTVSRLFKPGRKHERFHAAVCRRCCWPSSKSRRVTLSRGHSSHDGSTSEPAPPCAVDVADNTPHQGALQCLAVIQARTEARASPRRRAPSLLLTILQIKACYTASRPFKP